MCQKVIAYLLNIESIPYFIADVYHLKNLFQGTPLFFKKNNTKTMQKAKVKQKHKKKIVFQT